MKIRLQWLAATVMGLTVCAGSAMAGISIVPGAGAQEMIDDAGGNVAPWGLPLLPAPNGLTGYSSFGAGAGTAPNLLLTPGLYAFTYLGGGNATNTDTFTIGGNSFNNHTTALGTTFNVLISSPSYLSFTYSNTTTGTSITSGNAVASMAYGLFMQGSTNCTTASPDAPYACNGSGSPAIGPGTVAYIGLSDLPFTSGDHDFQDLGVKVTAIPEPATWAMMLLGIGCVGGVLRSQRRRQALSPA